MAAKTLYNNPTANPFELLGVEEEPEKRPTKGPQQKKPAGPAGGNQQPSQPQTPAEKAQRRKQQAKEARVKSQAEKEAEAQKRKEEQDKALAAMMDPLEGFQVQKGSQKQKPSEEKKPKTFTKDQFEKLEEKPNQEPRKFQNKTGKTPLAPREPPRERREHPDHREQREPRGNVPADGAPNKKEGHTGSDTRTQKFTPNERPNKPPRHEGYDKHSGSKFAGKSKKDGQDWGNPVQDWNANQATETTPLSGGGWGGDDQPAQSDAPATPGWGDESDPAAAQPSDDGAKDQAPAPVASSRPARPAWDDEGFGKMTLEEFQKTVAAQREKALKELTGTKQARTTVETQADPAKFLTKDKQFGDAKVVQKQPKQEPPKKQPQEQKKKQPVQKPQVQAVPVTDVFTVRTRGGAGRGRGGPAASRGQGATDRPSPTQTPPAEKWEGNSERPPRDSPKGPKRQGGPAGQDGGYNRRQGGGGGGGSEGYRVPHANQFPDLPVKNVQTEQSGGAAPAAQSAQTQTAVPTAAK